MAVMKPGCSVHHKVLTVTETGTQHLHFELKESSCTVVTRHSWGVWFGSVPLAVTTHGILNKNPVQVTVSTTPSWNTFIIGGHYTIVRLSH